MSLSPDTSDDPYLRAPTHRVHDPDSNIYEYKYKTTSPLPPMSVLRCVPRPTMTLCANSAVWQVRQLRSILQGATVLTCSWLPWPASCSQVFTCVEHAPLYIERTDKKVGGTGPEQSNKCVPCIRSVCSR